MLPVGGERIVVAGRCVAGDREANAAYGIPASCMGMGQAAGAAVALAVQSGRDLSRVTIEDLRAALRQYGAIVPPDLTTG